MRSRGKEIQKKTTIYDLAKIVNVSPGAVSSVLNGTWQKRRISQKLADRVIAVAQEQGYSVNAQASFLRREQTNIIGMIVPKYDNRYFGDIAEKFEARARTKGLFPVITCTQRDPELEYEAARELISYQAECLVSTGATDPDRITALCAASGVKSINVDLPGAAAPSVISDNYSGAHDLTNLILDRCEAELDWLGPLRFVGGRLSDHNTAARLEGFLDAQRARGISVPKAHVMANGYSAARAAAALEDLQPFEPVGIFVNSTITLEGVVRWFRDLDKGAHLVRYGCFDWDPFGAFLPNNVGMVEQNVEGMLDEAFRLIEKGGKPDEKILIPCILREF